MADGRAAADWLIEHGRSDPQAIGAGSYAFMELIGVVAIGWMWARMAAIAAADEKDPFMAAKLVTARHWALRKLPEIAALRGKVEAGAETLMALPAESFLRTD